MMKNPWCILVSNLNVKEKVMEEVLR
jgi:hypothetical protein